MIALPIKSRCVGREKIKSFSPGGCGKRNKGSTRKMIQPMMCHQIYFRVLMNRALDMNVDQPHKSYKKEWLYRPNPIQT